MKKNHIIVKGAREHNLKNIHVEIPRDQFTVITGLSGSGKSSLAFDTIYAEGQRRYVESLSSYARQFLGLMEKPDVDLIDGLSPAISIEQKTTHRNPRSTVATVTEIYDYLRLLFARIGDVYCYSCGDLLSSQTVQEITDQILAYPVKSKLEIMAPMVRGKKGEYKDFFQEIKKDGFLRARIDGRIVELTEDIQLEKNVKHNIDIIIDRLIVKEGIKQRLTESIETALKLANGTILIHDAISGEEKLFSEQFACMKCGIYYEEVEPRSFSFNSPFGACKQCDGLGELMEIDIDLLIADENLSIDDGALALFTKENRNWYYDQVKVLCQAFKIPLNQSWKELADSHKNLILNGAGKRQFEFSYGANIKYKSEFEGLIPNLRRRYKESDSGNVREKIQEYMSGKVCSACNGTRLRKESLSIQIDQKNIYEICALSIEASLVFFEKLALTGNKEIIAKQILKEIKERLYFLNNVGLSYLSLNRQAGTLSGGESQRIRLATQIGSQLCGVLYILDEPSIGLHQRDNQRLLDALFRLRDLGNTVLVVEHDKETIEQADYVLDLGPRAGKNGGYLVASDIPQNLDQYKESITGQYLSGKKSIKVPAKRRKGNGKFIQLFGAKGNNLKEITVTFPLGTFIAVTGVSGSGKSTLINATLYPILSRKIHHTKLNPLEYDSIEGTEQIDKVIDIDQSPIGRTPRSNPATYTGLFSPIRDLFSQIKEAKARGYKSGRFSFNVKGGRCENCEGDGVKKIEMHFLPDVYITCEQCKGKRYNRETLEIKYKGKSIADVLELTVDDALELFEAHPAIANKLNVLSQVGLGYIHLGQAATTLSGGEAQRIKLAGELARKGTGKTLYILDEPTTGLHFEDVRQLLEVLHQLVDKGNTVLVIEHNLDVIKTADYILDIGPEGGVKGGELVAYGSPEDLVKNFKTATSHFLKSELLNAKKNKQA